VHGERGSVSMSCGGEATITARVSTQPTDSAVLSVASCLSDSRITSASWWHFHPLHTSRTVAGALHPPQPPS
jgi:hypothetical protein